MNTTTTSSTIAHNPAAGLRGKDVLVTGGASGIGLAAAIQARAAGANVTIVGLDRERTARVAREHGFDGWRAADVTRPDQLQAALADVAHVDHLVLMAGTFVAGKVMEADVGYLQRAFDERIWSAIHTLRILGDRLARDGSVTFISGALAERPNAQGTAVLAAASSAMEALARGLALELAPLRVNALSPGMIDTPILAKALGSARDGAVEAMRRSTPLQRMGTADEAGAAIVFLMTNGWMSGATLNIDGAARFA
jgi:NAD(P)-dependent dehydrogenase (short-subunit alcohol dehydrogenase family)